MRTNHYIMEVSKPQNARDENAVKHSMWFDGSEAQALAYFKRSELFKRYRNRAAYLITVRANPIVLMDSRVAWQYS